MLDWQRLAVLTEKPAPEALPGAAAPTSVRIAVAKDEAFCFTYAETLDALRDAGAELVLFSPVQDAVLPENIGGLYLPGGYPELHAKTLSENKTMLASIRQAVQAGLPTAAECGGFLYLGRSLEDADGKAWPMADVLPGDGIRVGRLVRFGYAEMTAKADSMLFRAGETLPSTNSTTGIPPQTALHLLPAKTKKCSGNAAMQTRISMRLPAFILGGHALPGALCARQNDTAKQKDDLNDRN